MVCSRQSLLPRKCRYRKMCMCQLRTQSRHCMLCMFQTTHRMLYMTQTTTGLLRVNELDVTMPTKPT